VPPGRVLHAALHETLLSDMCYNSQDRSCGRKLLLSLDVAELQGRKVLKAMTFAVLMLSCCLEMMDG
jgi:hypothetical protein